MRTLAQICKDIAARPSCPGELVWELHLALLACHEGPAGPSDEERRMLATLPRGTLLRAIEMFRRPDPDGPSGYEAGWDVGERTLKAVRSQGHDDDTCLEAARFAEQFHRTGPLFERFDAYYLSLPPFARRDAWKEYRRGFNARLHNYWLDLVNQDVAQDEADYMHWQQEVYLGS